MSTSEERPVFRDLSADDPDPEITEVESLCMNCHQNGNTRLLLTRIPHYRNVVLMSFSCEHCGYENNEIQPGGAYEEMGIRWEVRVSTPEDLNRQVVKSDYTSVVIPQLEFEIPPRSQKGEVTTIEGIIRRAVSGLTQDQERRKLQHPVEASQIQQVADRLDALTRLEGGPWDIIIEDVSGNCFVENPNAPNKDPRCKRTDFKRSKEQNHMLGVFDHEEVDETLTPQLPAPLGGRLVSPGGEVGSYEKMSADEVLTFRTNCPECNAPADTNMKVTDIPYFKQVVIMATICDACGHRTNEVKSGGGIEPQGVKFEVRVACRQDFSRDILKSETCSMEIPELELSVGGRALGGRFTTSEGLLGATRDQLAAQPALWGAMGGSTERIIQQLDEVLSGKRGVTIVLTDPAGNSYVQSLHEDPTKPDDGLKITHFERSFEENEELGLNDMKTENYEES